MNFLLSLVLAGMMQGGVSGISPQPGGKIAIMCPNGQPAIAHGDHWDCRYRHRSRKRHSIANRYAQYRVPIVEPLGPDICNGKGCVLVTPTLGGQANILSICHGGKVERGVFTGGECVYSGRPESEPLTTKFYAYNGAADVKDWNGACMDAMTHKPVSCTPTPPPVTCSTPLTVGWGADQPIHGRIEAGGHPVCLCSDGTVKECH